MKQTLNKAKNQIEAFIKSLNWEDWAFLAILIMLVFFNFLLLSQLKQLPSPIYGGDYYNHLGTIEYLYQGGSVFESGQLAGEIHWVPWLYHVLVVGFALLTGLVPIMANIWFSIVILIASSFVIYILVSKTFENKLFGIIAVLFLASKFPIFKYSPFSYLFIIPLFMLAAYFFIRDKNLKTAIFTGIMYGFAGISNTHAFIYCTFFMTFLFLYFLLTDTSFENKRPKLKKELFRHLGFWGLAFMIGFIISLLWWFKPIFVYHGHTPNDIQNYGLMNVKDNMFGIVWLGLKNAFFNFNSVQSGVLSIFAIIGVVLLFFVKHRKPVHDLMLVATVTGIFGLFSHFITEPLLDNNIGPTVLFDASSYFATLWILFFFFTLTFITSLLNKINKLIPQILILIVALLLIVQLSTIHKAYLQDRWWQAGKSDIPPFLSQTASWIKDNTALNDVFLTTNEDSFAINSLTGRKMVTYRRTHSPIYADMNQRMLDAGILLYGNDDALREELVRKYGVKYLYWQPNWLRNEFHFDEQGQVQGFFDPLMFDYTLEREETLKRNNITYLRTQWYLDPAWMPFYPKRDILIIFPARQSMERPWSPQLDKYLNPVYNLTQDGQAITIIYEFKIP